MGNGRCVHVHVDKIIHATDKALLCRVGGEEVWIPISQVADGEDYEKGDRDITLSVTEYIAREKGLEPEE